MMSEQRVIAVDLGGTNLRAAVVSAAGELTHRRHVPSDAGAGPRVVSAKIAELIAAVAKDGDVPVEAAVGVAAPGPIEPIEGVVRFTPNLAGWRDFPLGQTLRSATGRSVHFGNDGNCAALGEARFGVGNQASDLIYLALGTGVGGGVIAGGRLIEGSGGLGGELGHVVVALDGPRCTCGGIGCLESFAAGWAIAREATIVASGSDGAAIRKAANGGTITASAVATAAAAGDAAALDLLDRIGRALGAAIGAFINIFNPQLVVLGGGVSSALGTLLLDPTRRAIPGHSFPALRETCRLERSILGDDTALYGAAALALGLSGRS